MATTRLIAWLLVRFRYPRPGDDLRSIIHDSFSSRLKFSVIVQNNRSLANRLKREMVVVEFRDLCKVISVLSQHRLRVQLLCVSVRRAAVSPEGGLRGSRQYGQVHLLRRRSGARQLAGRVREIRLQPPGPGQAAAVRGDVRHEGPHRWRRRQGGRHLPRADHEAGRSSPDLGMGEGLRVGGLRSR